MEHDERITVKTRLTIMGQVAKPPISGWYAPAPSYCLVGGAVYHLYRYVMHIITTILARIIAGIEWITTRMRITIMLIPGQYRKVMKQMMIPAGDHSQNKKR